jgi:hypothetical protein
VSLLVIQRAAEPPATGAHFSGRGTLTAATSQEQFSNVSLVGTGTLVAEGVREIVLNLQLTVLDPTLYYAPTAVNVVVDGGWPNMPVQFAIDGAVVLTDSLDSSGDYGPVSLPVSEAHGAAGVHTVSVAGTGTEASVGASGTFTLQRDPHPNPRVVGPDADPIDVPASHTATGVRRWVLQDLMPGGLGSWVLPRNPSSMSPPPIRRTLSQQHTTAVNGKFHITEAGIEAHDFTFSGFLRTKDEHDKFLAFRDLKRRIYLIDHRGRAWTVVIVDADLVPRMRIAEDDGSFNDWAHDYTINAVIHGNEWKVPQ